SAWNSCICLPIFSRSDLATETNARLCRLLYATELMAASMAMTTTTMSSSTIVKPDCLFLIISIIASIPTAYRFHKSPAIAHMLHWACMKKPIVHVKDYSLTIGSKRIVEQLDFEVFPGEVFAFLGANGSGKTSTIRSLLGI